MPGGDRMEVRVGVGSGGREYDIAATHAMMLVQQGAVQAQGGITGPLVGPPQLLTAANKLARLYQDQGRHEQAAPLYERALSIRERALGPEHPDVATCLENYALLLQTVGHSEEAAPLAARAWAIRAKHG